jgi:hypothetical protein
MEIINIHVELNKIEPIVVNQLLNLFTWKHSSINRVIFTTSFDVHKNVFKNLDIDSNEDHEKNEDFDLDDSNETFPVREDKSNVQKLNPGPPERPVYVEIKQKESKIQRV